MADQDYVFDSGIGLAVSAVFWIRPNTTVVSVFVDDLNIHGFLQSVKAFGRARNLIVNAHGSAEGEILVQLDSTSPKTTTYEDVVRASGSGSIKIPAEVLDASTNFRLVSCLIGLEHLEPLLKELKLALGNPNSVSAPAFLHVFSGPSYSLQSGKEIFYEFMSYDFRILGNEDGKKPLLTRDAVLGKFIDAGYKDVAGTYIPSEDWEKWVPPAAMLGLKSNGSSLKREFPNKDYITANQTWLWGLQTIPLPVVDSADFPKDDTAKMKILERELPKKDPYKDSYRLPVYRRYRFASLGDFVKGWNWAVTRVGKTQLQYVGTRYVYMLWIPIVKPGTTELIYNRYEEGATPTINFTESNQPYKLFSVV